MIMHIPHASRRIPPEVRSTLLPSDQDLARELLRMTDAWTDVLFEVPSGIGCKAVVFPFSRLVLDPERFEDDAHGADGRAWDGRRLLRTSSGMPLRAPLTTQERELLLRDVLPPSPRVS